MAETLPTRKAVRTNDATDDELLALRIAYAEDALKTEAEWRDSIDWQAFADELVRSGFRDGEMSTTLLHALLRAMDAALRMEEADAR